MIANVLLTADSLNLDDQYEGSFHHYRRRSEGGSASFGNADDVYMFNATRTIFVGNIERNTTSSELKRMFERYGEIVVSSGTKM